jgi:hypothetical protein
MPHAEDIQRRNPDCKSIDLDVRRIVSIAISTLYLVLCRMGGVYVFFHFILRPLDYYGRYTHIAASLHPMKLRTDGFSFKLGMNIVPPRASILLYCLTCFVVNGVNMASVSTSERHFI